MAGQRIPQLPTITGVNVATGDKFLVYDLSTDTTKAITRAELDTVIDNALTPAVIISKFNSADGSGSGTDADMLDGLHAAAFALLTGAAFTGNVSTTGTLTTTGAATFSNKLTAGSLQAPIEMFSAVGDFTLVAGNANKQVFIDGNVTVPSSVFSQGMMIGIHADTSDRQIIRGSGLQLFSDGTDVAQVYLRPRRSAVLIFESASICRVIGGTATAP